MELLQIAVGKEKYSIKGAESGKLKSELEKGDKESPLHNFFTALAVCHTVVPEPAGEADETEQEHPHEEHHGHHFPALPHFVLHSKKDKSPEIDTESHKQQKIQHEKTKHIQADDTDKERINLLLLILILYTYHQFD